MNSRTKMKGSRCNNIINSFYGKLFAIIIFCLLLFRYFPNSCSTNDVEISEGVVVQKNENDCCSCNTSQNTPPNLSSEPTQQNSKTIVKTKLVRKLAIADVTEITLYENICMDSSGIVFVDDDAIKSNRQFVNHDGGDQVNDFNIFRGKVNPEAPLPVFSHVRGKYSDASFFQNPTEDCTVFSVLSDWSGANVFHWSIKLIPAWEFIQSTQLCVSPKVLLHRNPNDYHEWQREFTKALFAVTDAKIELVENLPRRCFRQLLVTGTNIAGVSSSSKALQMRNQINTYMGYNFKFELRHVVYLHRSSRNVVNHPELVKYMEGVINQPIKVVNFETMSFKEQFELISSCAILVTTHGAGLTNSMLMPTGSSVVEIINPRYIVSIYDRMAVNSGLYHIRYLAKLSEVTSPPQQANQAGWGSARCLSDSSCATLSKNINLRVDVAEFAVVFRQAVSASWPGEVKF